MPHELPLRLVTMVLKFKFEAFIWRWWQEKLLWLIKDELELAELDWLRFLLLLQLLISLPRGRRVHLLSLLGRKDGFKIFQLILDLCIVTVNIGLLLRGP